MMTLNDAISSALGGQPIIDGLAQYYLATGGSGSNLYDIERSWLVAKIGHDSGGTVNDLWREYLAVPPGGSLNDGLLLYWSGVPVANLFRNSEQGVWYDPSDFATMFQDSTGTTPVTAVGQPVGLILDKRLGLVRGPEKWDDALASVMGSSSRVSPGVYRIYSPDGASSQVYVSTGTNGAWYEVSFTIDSITSGAVSTDFSSSPSWNTPGRKTFINRLVGTGITFKRSGVTDAQISNISVRELPGNHATQGTATSRPVLQQDSGGRYYLAFDGTDDSLATASIDFGASDKMTIVAGIQRDTATVGMLLELSANVNSFPSAFYLTSYLSGGQSAEFRAGGTTVPSGTDSAHLPSAGVPTPDRCILTAIGDIAGDLTRLRRNGVAGTDGVLDQGTGNFGNYPLYIGRRGGSSLPFNGRLYQLIVRGALTPNLSQIESYVNLKTGAY